MGEDTGYSLFLMGMLILMLLGVIFLAWQAQKALDKSKAEKERKKP